MNQKTIEPDNWLLTALSRSDLAGLVSHLETTSLTPGQVIYEPGQIITHVYFPNSAVISLMLILSNGLTTEVALIGKEGLVGLTAILGGNCATKRHIVKIGGLALKIPVGILRKQVLEHNSLQKILLLYTQLRLSLLNHLVACFSHHTIEQILSRWLLSVSDLCDRNILPLTQKSIATTLGVRRASITEAALSLQKDGIIQYSRGQITIIDRPKLEAKSCECYAAMKNQFSCYCQAINCRKKISN
jgi:CRP-like cAMP-binding protein